MRRRLKQRHRASGAQRTVACLAMSLVLAACGGVIKFSDTTPLTIQGPAMEAPPPQIKRVQVKADRIEITEKIQFELAKATLMPESSSLLDEIVQVLKDNPSIQKIDIVGHTSAEGNDIYNQKLSEDRAKSVREYLTKHGIDAARLSSKGFGKTQPIADNATAAGREKNRRVEFIILEQATGGTQ